LLHQYISFSINWKIVRKMYSYKRMFRALTFYKYHIVRQ
jgi:hypothetical protein